MLFVLAIKTYYYQNHWQRHGLARKNQKLCFFKLFFLKQLTHGTDRFLVLFFFFLTLCLQNKTGKIIKLEKKKK